MPTKQYAYQLIHNTIKTGNKVKDTPNKRWLKLERSL